MTTIRYQQALMRALRDEMTADPSVIVLGEDVRQSLRGVTRGLYADFGPDRVIDTPLSEQAFVSFATGAALRGLRPVVEFQIPSLLYLTFEQIVNQAQKFRLMTGGQSGVPVTYYVPGSGAREGLAGQHSDHPYTFFAHAGVRTVVAASPQDAYSQFRAAIRDDDPVVLFAPAASLGVRGEVEPDAEAPGIGRAAVVRPGADVTVVAVGHLVALAVEVADELEGTISVEVIDARSVFPVDRELLRASAARTGRLVALDDTNITCGFAAEVVASVVTDVRLESPPVRLARRDGTIPFAPELEREMLPSRADLVAALHAVMIPESERRTRA